MVFVQLHGHLRDYLPIEKKGKDSISIPADKTVGALLTYLKINRRVEVAINNDIEVEKDHILKEGDQVHIFTGFGGG